MFWRNWRALFHEYFPVICHHFLLYVNYMEWTFFWGGRPTWLSDRSGCFDWRVGHVFFDYSFEKQKNGSVEWAPRLLLSFGAVPRLKPFRRHLISMELNRLFYESALCNDRKCCASIDKSIQLIAIHRAHKRPHYNSFNMFDWVRFGW